MEQCRNDPFMKGLGGFFYDLRLSIFVMFGYMFQELRPVRGFPRSHDCQFKMAVHVRREAGSG